MADDERQLTDDDLELLSQAHETAKRMRDEIAKVIVGQKTTVNAILTSVLSQGHTLVIGVPGLAKTLLVKTVAEVLGWSFKRIQFTPDMMPADIIGMELLQQDSESGRRSMEFVPGPLFAQMMLVTMRPEQLVSPLPVLPCTVVHAMSAPQLYRPSPALCHTMLLWMRPSQKARPPPSSSAELLKIRLLWTRPSQL